MDTSKHIFQLHGVDAAERPVLRRKLRRRDMIAFFERLPPTRVAIEACGASHHWARLLRGFGHEVQLIAPHLVKPYVKRGKNDAADAEALCEAMSRPTMRFVPVKAAEQQAALMLVGLRDRLVRNRTQLANAIRSYAAEFGITGATGLAHVPALLRRIQADETLPPLARELFALHAAEYEQVQVSTAAQIGRMRRSKIKFPRVTGEDLVSVPCSAWELGGGRRSSLAPVFNCPEPIALAIHLQNVHVVRETVEQRSRQALRAKHARLLVKRQIARHDH